ncbi:MAG TPA: hypothetical protein VK171_16145 [Fimbriimonas sp.]|nr:hypothetical protein [Fimbriimonas sp.]
MALIALVLLAWTPRQVAKTTELSSAFAADRERLIKEYEAKNGKPYDEKLPWIANEIERAPAYTRTINYAGSVILLIAAIGLWFLAGRRAPHTRAEC